LGGGVCHQKLLKLGKSLKNFEEAGCRLLGHPKPCGERVFLLAGQNITILGKEKFHGKVLQELERSTGVSLREREEHAQRCSNSRYEQAAAGAKSGTTAGKYG
jgi:hypothetical protein